MAKTAIRSKTTKKIATIDAAIAAYVDDLNASSELMEAENARVVLDIFADFINGAAEDEDDTDASKAEDYCTQAAPAALIDHLDRFLRYGIMREMVLNFDQQQTIFTTVYEFCDWLRHKGLILAKDASIFEALRDQHIDMWKQISDVAKAIKASLPKTSPSSTVNSDNFIEFARHDVAKIAGDKIWLEIWSPMILPEETTIGPITLPKGLAASLQIGWMLGCELRKTKSVWQITDIGQCYPAMQY